MYILMLIKQFSNIKEYVKYVPQIFDILCVIIIIYAFISF
jgi:hypothetical protein